MALDPLQPIHSENILNKDGFSVSVYIDDGSVSTAYGVFFIAPRPCEVLVVSERHNVVGSDAGDVTLQIEKLTSGQALDAGAAVLTTSFSLKSTVDTVVTKQLADLNRTNVQLKAGDALALKDGGVLTAVQGVTITVYLKPLGKGDYR